jgi:hypothetical protein
MLLFVRGIRLVWNSIENSLVLFCLSFLWSLTIVVRITTCWSLREKLLFRRRKYEVYGCICVRHGSDIYRVINFRRVLSLNTLGGFVSFADGNLLQSISASFHENLWTKIRSMGYRPDTDFWIEKDRKLWRTLRIHRHVCRWCIQVTRKEFVFCRSHESTFVRLIDLVHI